MKDMEDQAKEDSFQQRKPKRKRRRTQRNSHLRKNEKKRQRKLEALRNLSGEETSFEMATVMAMETEDKCTNKPSTPVPPAPLVALLQRDPDVQKYIQELQNNLEYNVPKRKAASAQGL